MALSNRALIRCVRPISGRVAWTSLPSTLQDRGSCDSGTTARADIAAGSATGSERVVGSAAPGLGRGGAWRRGDVAPPGLVECSIQGSVGPPPCGAHPAEGTLWGPPCTAYPAGSTLPAPPCGHHPASTQTPFLRRTCPSSAECTLTVRPFSSKQSE